jgi:CBS domain-containing protein
MINPVCRTRQAKNQIIMGIKSFQGPRAKTVSKKEYKAPIMVTDYMTRKLVTFTPDQSILAVMELFTKHDISGGPVLDDNGFLVGIISEADCMKQISESRYFNQPILDKSVEKFMTSEVETIPHDTSIFDAACIFDKHNRRRLPVMQDGVIVGQISRKDVVIAALKLSGQNW